MNKDYYKILGVARDATKEEIGRAYRALAKRYHPDVNPDRNAQKRFIEITEAYQILSDPKKRRVYDQFGPSTPKHRKKTEREVSQDEKTDLSPEKQIEVQRLLLERFRKLYNISVPKRYPPLRTYNGFGIMLMGFLPLQCRVTVEYQGKLWEKIFNVDIKVAWLCFLFIPVVPIGIYAVEDTGRDSYLFYGKLSPSNPLMNRNNLIKLVITSYIHGFAFMVALFVIATIIYFLRGHIG